MGGYKSGRRPQRLAAVRAEIRSQTTLLVDSVQPRARWAAQAGWHPRWGLGSLPCEQLEPLGKAGRQTRRTMKMGPRHHSCRRVESGEEL